MNYCIRRAEKLTAFGSIAGSAKHTFREIPAPNVDESRSHLNWTNGATTSAAVCAAVAAVLPAKRRKDAVLCVEYLITASPEWFLSTSKKVHQDYFNGAIAWLRRRHGATNIVCLNLQLDEKTPHLVAYVVPLMKDGRLSAKEFLGGRAKLSAMQTDFWNAVGRPAGLDRGLEGSTAKHVTAKQYSAALAQNPTLEPPEVLRRSLSDWIMGRAGTIQRIRQADFAAHVRLIEQARSEALLGKQAREQQSQALRRLRDRLGVLEGSRVEAERLATENQTLTLELNRQRECSDEKMKATKGQLEQAKAKIKSLLSEIRMWRREAEAARAEVDDLQELLNPALERERPTLAES